MPVHIFGTGGGGGGKNALTVYFTPTDARSYTFTIDDVDFAQRFNAAKTTKHFELVFEGDMTVPDSGKYAVCYISQGVIEGNESKRVILERAPDFTIGPVSTSFWREPFVISGSSASFTVSLDIAMNFSLGKKHRATWICEE